MDTGESRQESAPEPEPPTEEAVADNCEERLQEARCEAELAAVEAETRLREARTEIEIERTIREERERAEREDRLRAEREAEANRRERERVAREETVRSWRAEQGRRWRERREGRRKFFSSLAKNWRNRQDSQQGQAGTLRVLVAMGIPATVAFLVYALPLKSEVLGIGLLVAVASFAAGALLGFLFGIPRTVGAPREDEPQAAGKKEPIADAATNAQRFGPNTNLEQISDWLTKILVGVGLIQVHQVGDAIDDLASGLAPGLGAQGKVVAIALMVTFAITGFVSAYLFTRLRLQTAFELAGAIRQAIKERADTETGVIALVHRQLDPVGANPSLAELTEALKAAPIGIRSQAFYLARDQRRACARAGDGSGVARTAPVFEALIAADAQRRYHRNHAELGYVLKDQDSPDLARAMGELEAAIAIRPEGKEKPYWLYEFNLAYCEIELDHAGFGTGQPSSPTVAAAIAAHLSVPAEVPNGRKAIRREEHRGKTNPVAEWVRRNSDRPELSSLLTQLSSA